MAGTRFFVTLAAIAAVAAPAAAQQGGPGWDRGWHMYDGGWMWWMPFHGILSLLLVAAVVVGVVFLIRWLWHGTEARPTAGSRREALELLDLRYARGEIDRDDYLQRKKDLAGGGD